MNQPTQSARSLVQGSALDALRGEDADRWPNITAAQALSHVKASLLKEIVDDLIPTDEGALVVFGSLARHEYTVESDLDWTIIIDGRADSRHLDIVHSLKPRLRDAGFKVPGPAEVFGGLVFSHDLIHAIGGDEDTNKNMTRRLLLLLESTPIDRSRSMEVHTRIIKGILHRYVEEDASFISSNRRPDRIPRFLLNDVVRFWRTMAVDYANKYRARAGEKWALRNIKLRMSRKLLFVSGFFMCLSCALSSQGHADQQFTSQKLVDDLLKWTQTPALESLAYIVAKHAPQLSGNIFDAYDSFLLLLSDEEARQTLEELSPEDAYQNEVFLGARKNATEFDESLTKLLFESDDRVTQLVKKYGVF
jgi:hypothetical protein